MPETFDTAYLSHVAQSPDAEIRATLARQIGELFCAEDADPSQLADLHLLLELLCEDTVIKVRRTLARSLGRSALVPKDIVRRLVCDVEEVSLPLIELTRSLSVSDLLALLKSGSRLQKQAVSRRRVIERRLAEAIAATDDETLCLTILRNPKADIGERGFEHLVSVFAENETIRTALGRRLDLPLHVSIMLTRQKQDAPADAPLDLVNGTARQSSWRDERYMNLICRTGSSPESMNKTAVLIAQHGEMTASLVLRASFAGMASFVEQALHVISGVPLKKVRSLLYGKARLGSRAIYLRAGLPADAYPAFRLALDLHMDVQQAAIEVTPEAFGRRLVELAVTECEELDPLDRKTMLDLISRLGPDTARYLAQQLGDNLSAAA